MTWSGGITKIQAGSAGCWLTADETSSITLAFNGNSKQLEGSDAYPFKLSSASAGGITWTSGLADAGNTSLPFWYYLKGAGTVVYGGDITVANAQVIKQADVTLTGTSQVSSKTLVAFGSGTTKTFTADATVNVYDSEGETIVETLTLATVNSTGATTLTTDDPVGSCELVQTSTGVLLYYVDGTPAAYTPSININFTNASSSGLGTTDNVGYGSYAVPGGSWNNFTVANNANTQTFGTVAAMNSLGVASTVSGAGVTVSGQRGSYNCSLLTAASNLLYGYIDDGSGSGQANPTVTITGIPYERYRVIVYAAADTANATFGYMTVNNINYTYDVNGALTTGTTAWGNAGADKSANELSEGGNVLVSAVTSGSTATIIGHRSSNTCRGNIAAVQIVEYTPSAGENDLLIELDGVQTCTFDEAKAYDTVYVTGSGTLTFAGEASTASVLDISGSAAVNMGGSLTPAAVTGNGTAIYTGATPTTGLGWADGSKWQGTLWVKNTTFTGVVPNTMANANSTLRLSGVVGYFNNGGSKQTCDGTLELENDSYSYAFSVSDGYSTSGITVFAKLKGSGLLGVQSANIAQRYVFKDASEFTGTFNLAARTLRVILGDGESLSPDEGTITIVSGATATVASGKTWTANTGGFRVEGTLNVNGTLASSASAAIKGSGTVVSTGKLPSVSGSAWWQNTGWEGTLWIKSVAISELNSNLYGNEGSTLKFTGVTGYFAQSHVNTVPIELEDSDSTVAFKYNNGWGGELLTFSELKGTGTLQTSSAGDGGTIWVKKWGAFTGVMNLGKKQVVMGGSEPVHDNVNRGGKLVIAEGAVVTNLNATTSWTAGGDIEVNGTFAASDRTAWASGTAMTINSTGVLNMYGSGVNDTSKSFANVTGTGTIWYSQTTTANDKWSALPSSAANMFANTLSVSNDNVNAGVIITMNGASDVVTTNANVSGTGWYRSDWETGTYRGFLALQSKNTTWSGTFGSSSRIKKFIVAGVDGATDRTLTLAGTQSSTIPLTVESLGSVNITGTYLGATTVSGTFGGTGTLTGNLTFNAGSTLKAFASDANGLAVSGTVTFPTTDGESVTVDLSGATLSGSGTTLITTTGGTINDISKLSVSGAVLALENEGAVLKAYPIAALVESDGTPHFYDNIAQAMSAAMLQYSQTYDHFELYASIGETVSLNATWLSSGAFKLKTCNGATVTVQAASAEYSVEAGEADENEIVTYTGGNAATTYTWNWSSGTATWNLPKNWTYGNGTTATRAPVAGDTVVFNDGATVTLGGNAACAAMTVNGAASISGAYNLTVSGNVTGGTGTPVLSLTGAKLSLSASSTVSGISLVLADANATLVVPSGATVPPVPTTSVAGCVVKATTVDGTTTYSVVAKGFFFMTY